MGGRRKRPQVLSEVRPLVVRVRHENLDLSFLILAKKGRKEGREKKEENEARK
jgi:hypothetical protein